MKDSYPDWEDQCELDLAFLDWDFININIQEKKRKQEFQSTLDDILAWPVTIKNIPIEELE